MAKQSAFVLPAGLELDLSGSELSVRFEGDVVLEQTLGKTLGEVHADGDLILRLDVANGRLSAGNRLQCTGAVDAEHLHGREVHIGDVDVRAGAISATERIVIGAANLKVDAIIAPIILLDADATGRVTVIESKNERGPTKIKGGFSIKEYEELIGDSEEFLAERGLSPLADGPMPDMESFEGPFDSSDVVEDDSDDETAADRDLPHMAHPEPLAEDEDEDTDDPESLSIEDLEPIQETDDLHPRLAEALKRITSCYEGTEVPPAVDSLQELVESRDYDRLRANITEVWNGLLGFHQKRGIRPHHQVTHAFNIIHGLVQEA